MQIVIEIQDRTKALNFVQFLEQIPYIKIDRNIYNNFKTNLNYNNAQVQKFKGIVKNSSINKIDWYHQ